jgi:hypothetical protein
MEESREKKQVFQIICPICQSLLWVDSSTEEVIQFEKKGGKRKKSLDELLVKEKKRKDEFGKKFEATAELEREKKKKAKEKFEKVLIEIEKED